MTIQTLVVGMISTNCYVLTDDATGQSVIIDPGARSPRIQKAIELAGKENIAAILLTHGHFDHVTGLPFVKELTGAPVCIHEADAPFLRADGPNPRGTRLKRDCEADRLLRDGDVIACGKLTIRVMHTPGHTPGGCCFLCEDTIFSGDTLFYHEVGRADFPYSDYQAELRSVDRLKALPGNYTVLPGHGPPTTLQEERDNNPYMNR